MASCARYICVSSLRRSRHNCDADGVARRRVFKVMLKAVINEHHAAVTAVERSPHPPPPRPLPLPRWGRLGGAVSSAKQNSTILYRHHASQILSFCCGIYFYFPPIWVDIGHFNVYNVIITGARSVSASGHHRRMTRI